MKTIVLALVLLSTTVFGQIKYSTTTELRNYKTNSTAGASPVGADFGGKTIACLNTANHLVYLRPGLEIIPSYFMFPYKYGIGSTSPVVVTSYQRYGYPKFQYSVKTSDIYGNIPPRTDFTSPSIRCLNADGKMYYMVNGVVKIEWLIVPYSIACEYVYSDWSDCSPNGIKTRTVVSQSPEGCAGAPILTAVCTYTPPPVACTYVYTPWSSCDSNGIRTRTVINSYPYACTGIPVLIDSCEYVPPTCAYTYSVWSACGEDGTRTRTVTGSSPVGCVGTPILVDSCIYVPPVCIYTYSDWGDCIDGLKTRVVTDSTPNGCAGTPVLVQACEPIVCTYTYSAWSPCDITGHRTRTLLSSSPIGCTGTPVLSETCTYVPPTCTYTYSAWSTCSQSGYQTRTVISSTPGGCQGTPVLTQSCTYVPPVVPHGDHNYYVSSTTGNDNYTSTQAHSSATPWRTLGKVSSFSSSMVAGDSVLFKKGDTFAGTLTISCSGTSAKPVIVSSYSTGANPIISGLQTVTGWTKENDSIYSKAITAQSQPNILSFNGQNTPLGKFPKMGYLSVDSHVTNTTITDAALNSAVINWTGAEIVQKKYTWVVDRSPVTAHSGSTITYTSGSPNNAQNGYGYFFQNDLKCLSKLGDWAYKSGKLYMYFGNHNPSEYVVKASVIDNLFAATSKNYITIDGIDFEGANVSAVKLSAAQHITVNRCNINFVGGAAIDAVSASPYFTLTNSTVRNANGKGIALIYNSNYAVITNNSFDRIGQFAGMGTNSMVNGSTSTQFSALSINQCSNVLIQDNIIDSSGYCGITLTGSNIIVNRNFINRFCTTSDDGGGIYTGVNSYTGRVISNNIVINGIGSPEGTTSSTGGAEGIYLDYMGSNISVLNNTTANCVSGGIYIHNGHDNTIRGNVSYNNGYQIYYSQNNTDDKIRNNKMFDNLLVAPLTTQNTLKYHSGFADINLFGTADSNYYFKPLQESTSIATDLSWAVTYRTLTNWKVFVSQDAHSVVTPRSVTEYLFEYNATLANKTITITGTWYNKDNIAISGSIALPPFTSTILIR